MRIPLRFEVDYPARSPRALQFVKLPLVAPHVLALACAWLCAAVAWALASVWIAVTGRWPRWAFDVIVGAGRWTVRVIAYVCLLTDAYPPFTPRDDPRHPVRLHVNRPPGGRVARWRPLVAWAVVLPQALMLVALDIGLLFVGVGALAAVAAAATFPRHMFDLVVRSARFNGHVTIYALGMTEVYPGFAVT